MLSKFILFILIITVIVLLIFCTKLYLQIKNMGKKSNIGIDDRTIQKIDLSSNTGVSTSQEDCSTLIKEKNSLQSCYDEKLKEIENLNNQIKNLENLETENKNLIDKINIQTKEIEEYKNKIKTIKNQISLFSDKSLKSTFLFANGQKEGEEKIFFKGEAFLNKIKNWHDGILEGPSTVFYKTGEKYIEMYYKDGKIDGNYIVYNKDGSIKETYSYKDGVAHE